MAYENKRLTINGQPVRAEQNGTYQYVDKGWITETSYQEYLKQAPSDDCR